MARLMSVTYTEEQVRSRVKTVTRRTGWKFLRPGAELCLCRQVQGRKPGQPLVRIAYVQVVAVRREPLSAITPEEVALEGFPGMSPAEFVDRFFVEAQGIGSPDIEITRIEWTYLDTAEAMPQAQRPSQAAAPRASGQMSLSLPTGYSEKCSSAEGFV